MDKAKRSIAVLRDWVEVYIPVASFAIMFLVFILQVFFRYVVRSPLQWAYEVTVSCYLWLVMLGACLAQRDHSHVVFTLITDSMPIKLRAVCSFLGSALIAVAFIWSFVPSIEFVDFMKMQKTSVLKIGLNIVYAPYIPFLVIMIIYMLREMYQDARIFLGLAGEVEIKHYINAQMTEAEAAIESAQIREDSE
ncbi:MAG: TRAP transporter small permease [Clostridia bacterium]|nr:TRAP transporter small permease [Clostridia bacterium]